LKKEPKKIVRIFPSFFPKAGVFLKVTQKLCFNFMEQLKSKKRSKDPSFQLKIRLTQRDKSIGMCHPHQYHFETSRSMFSALAL